MDGLDDALARAREAVRALAAASASSSDGGAARAKEASRLLREVERAVEYAQRAAAGEAGSESERALALSRLQQVERAARELRAAVRTIVRAEGAGVPPGVAQREQLAFLLQQPGGQGSSRGSGSGGAAGNNKKGWQKGGKAAGSVVDAVGESKEVTRSLARTRELMSQELRRMGGVVDVIEEDGEALVETHMAHARIGTALDRADALLRRLKRQEQLDRLSKRLALCLFLATVAFIVARRLWLPNPAPYIRLVRRVAAPLVPAQWKQQRPPSEEEQGLPFPPMAPPVALPSKGKGEEGVDVGVDGDGEVDAGDGGSLVGRAKEAWRTLAEGLEEIKEMQQLEQEQEQQAAEAEAAAVAAAAGEVEQEQEGAGVVVEEQEEPRPPPQMEEQQEEEKEPPQDEEEEEEEEEEEAAQGAEPAPPTRDDETPAPHEEL